MLIAALGLGSMAILSYYWQRYTDMPLLAFALSVMVFSYSGLLGVYFNALFTKRGNSTSVLVALIAGFVTTLLFQPYIQDSLNISFGADLTNRYILNGTDVGGNSPAIQPHAEISKKGLAFGIWGSFATNAVSANEMDWYLKYTFNNLISIQFMDVFFPKVERGCLYTKPGSQKSLSKFKIKHYFTQNV